MKNTRFLKGIIFNSTPITLLCLAIFTIAPNNMSNSHSSIKLVVQHIDTTNRQLVQTSKRNKLINLDIK